MRIPSRGELTKERVRRRGLHEFFRLFWAVADPACPGFVDNWHYSAIADVLTAVSRRQIRKVVINMPPGLGKSLTVDVLWQAWHWTFDPSHAWMSISFDHQLVLRDARRLLAVLNSELYRAAWPEFELGDSSKRAEGEFYNAHGGYRFSTSFEGKGTGRHVNTQVCDDPCKPKDWNNEKKLQSIIDIWNGTFASRAINAADFSRVIIMQRLAENDLAGAMLREHGYEHLCLPMRYVPSCPWDIGCSLGKLDPRTADGELLFPARFPEEVCKERRKEFGSAAIVEAQEQQNPTPDVGGIIEKGWLGHIWIKRPMRWRKIQSWDFGFKGASEAHSRVGGAIYAEWMGQVHLVTETNPKQIGFPESKKLFFETQELDEWRDCSMILIEDKANGSAIIQEIKQVREHEALSDLRREHKAIARRIARLIKPVNPVDDKTTRLIAHSDFIESGGLLLPTAEQMPTVEAWRLEVVGFPKARYNDRVDMLSQALDHLLSPHKRVAEALRGLK